MITGRDLLPVRCRCHALTLNLSTTQEEIEEEVVDYEPWMDDHGSSPDGVEFDADDPLCSMHPEVWLSSKTVKEIKDDIERQRKEAEAAAAAKRESKKEGKK